MNRFPVLKVNTGAIRENEQDKIHSVLLMLDVGDRREGVVGKERLLELADATTAIESAIGHEPENVRIEYI
jgi:predicted amino acid racemase